MKTLRLLLLLSLIGIVLSGCGSGGGESSNAVASDNDLRINQTRVDTISTEGEVDLYHISADRTGSFLRVTCTENIPSGVDLLVIAYDGQPNGDSNRIFGVQKDDPDANAADIDFLIPIENAPRNIYITVRDLMDDDKHIVNDQNVQQTYRLLVRYVDSPAAGPNNIQNARTLALETTLRGEIASVNEIDAFTFAPDENGVYRIEVVPPLDDSQIQLSSGLYDALGSRLQRIHAPASTILAYLRVADGPYFITVEDADSMDADASAVYSMTVTRVSEEHVHEALTNDTPQASTGIEINGGIYTAAGAIDYTCSSNRPDNAGDKDWYRFSIGQAGDGVYHQVELTMDNGEQVNLPAIISATVYADPPVQNQRIMYHQFNTADGLFRNQFRVPSGTYLLLVEDVSVIQGTSYEITLRESTIIDAYESVDDNTTNTARVLTSGVVLQDVNNPTMISYVGDVDWYSIEIPGNTPQILSVYLSSPISEVDYAVDICIEGLCATPQKRVVDINGADTQTRLKASIYVGPGHEGDIYYIKVADAQSDDGSGLPYEIMARMDPVPDNAGRTGAPSHIYYSEASEQNRADGTYQEDPLKVEIYSNFNMDFEVNTNILDFRNPLPGTDIQTLENGTTTISFPWIGGYIDYQGDHDFFKIDFGKYGNGTETEWYYDVVVQIQTVGNGSHVEYVWKLYQDGNRNNIVIDYPTTHVMVNGNEQTYNSDGYKACAGDTTPSDINGGEYPNAQAAWSTMQAINITTPNGSTDRSFYIPSVNNDGSSWGAGSQFFFGISDMIFLKFPDSANNDNRALLADVPWQDDDWDYAASPYYFKVSLTYHPNQTRP